GKFPDYVLYESNTNNPIAIIEAKRRGQSIQKALEQAIKLYARPLNIDIVFAVDGTFVKAFSIKNNSFLAIDEEPLTELISEKRLIRFLKEGYNIKETTEIVKHSRDELIKIFRWANDLLRKEGLRNLDRFVEFANILFIKIVSEIEEDRERNGQKRRLDNSLCWESFENFKDSKQMLNYINNSVLKEGLAKKYNHSDDIFQEKLKIKNPDTLKEIVNRLSKITLINTESEIKGDAFEYFLKNLASGNDLGEYFTPRHIVKMMVKITNPKYGEKVYDLACGTGGFLIEAFRHIKKSSNTENKEISKQLTEKTIFGIELTDTYKIAKMNMIIIGDGHNNIIQNDSLAPESISENEYDVILTNPPYSQETDYGEYYPIPSKQADPIFLQSIIKSLKQNRRAGVIVPEGLLFRSGNFQKTREYLLQECEVEAIISLPSGVFLPYTDVKTDIIMFKKGKSTKKVWFYMIENDGFELNKNRRPIKGSDIPELLEIWEEKPESNNSFSVSIDRINKNKFSLKPEDYIQKKAIRSKYPLKKISDIGELTSGSTAPQKREHFENGKYPFIRVKDLTFPENWKYVVKTRDKVNDKSVAEKRLVLSEKGSVIFPKSGVSLLHNRRAILNQDSYVVNHFAIIKPNKNIISPEYLYYVLKKIDMGEYCSRTTLPSLNLSVIKDILIPVPSPKDQKEVIEKIEKEEKEIDKEIYKIKMKRENINKVVEDLFSH
ncbi:hypothetical protein CMI48_04465, partial [Candidatus Pacearchaeota archaeon]|nr:hypothetical protein [Candidatus Pacearchaeota archaeon]